ncbi:MAG: nucleoside hydrolase [Defluviitaleaceae bacterium]|nr:nucleoside hydrolase [Defluviitaleaceae bacterium]
MDYLDRLKKPTTPVDVILDTDAYNEIDDQFAIAYLVKNSEKLNVQAFYAAPFLNQRSKTPKEGMEKSFAEIQNILNLMDVPNHSVFKGSEHFLVDEKTPCKSAAAADLAERAERYSPQNPLYVVAIGAITNVASAILLNPAIVDKIVIVWLGGHSFEWHDNTEFNMSQDVAAARIVLGCGAAVVLLPCMGVVSAFNTTAPELKHWLTGKNKLCDYLLNHTITQATEEHQYPTWARSIWDVTAVAWLLDPAFMLDRLEHSPVPTYENKWAFDKTRHLVRYVYFINRERLFFDLFEKLGK